MSQVSKRTEPKFSDRLEYIAFRAIVGLVRTLPEKTAITMMGGLWQAIAPHLSRHKRAEKHLAAAMPHLSRDEREKILSDMWRNLGMTTAETMIIDRIWPDGTRVSYSDPALAEDIINSERAVVITLHQGNWEMTVSPLTRKGHKVAAVYQKIRNPLVERFVKSQRDGLYQGGLYDKGKEAVAGLMRHARTGFVGIVSDLRDAKKVTVPFFDMPAPSTPFPALIAISRNMPIVAGRALRIAPGQYRIDVANVPVSRTGDRDKDIYETTAAIQRQFETWVRENPEQWMWGHRRWSNLEKITHSDTTPL